MGRINRDFHEDEIVSSFSSSLSETLLFATMCIIGLPVDVHVKDGSVYSGIFHTACVENGYGIILKKARMIIKGKRNTNIANSGSIDTLVILSDDLVQVVAKGVLLPADGIAGNMVNSDTEVVVGPAPADESLENYPKKSVKSAMDRTINGKWNLMQNENNNEHTFMSAYPRKEHESRKVSPDDVGNSLEVEHGNKDWKNLVKIKEVSGATNNGRQCGNDGLKGGQIGFREKLGLQEEDREESADKGQSSSSSLGTSLTQVQSVEQGHTKMASELLTSEVSPYYTPVYVKINNQYCERPTSADTSSLAVSSGVPSSLNPSPDVVSESCNNLIVTSTDTVPSHIPDSNKAAKEFKLNPGAKIFSPSFANTISATQAVPTVASMGYIPSTSPAVPVAVGQPEVGMGPLTSHSSVAVKVVPYGNSTPGNGGTGSQFSQPVVGHVGSRTQQLRYAGQHPLQAGPAFVHPSSQAVMVGGRLGQLVYLHPVSQEMVQGVTAMSPLSVRSIMPPQQVPFPKHQGISAGQTMQLYVPPPFVTGGQQPFGMPYHISVLQPSYPNNRPTQVPASINSYGSKFS